MIFWLLLEHLKTYYWDNDRDVVDLLIDISNREWDNLREHPEVKSMLVSNELVG